MFWSKVLKRFQKSIGSWATVTPVRHKPRRTTRPWLEGLEDRIVPAFDTWIAPAGSTSWDVGTNWSAGHSPAAGDTAVFSSNSNTPCVIPAGDNLPTLGQLQVAAWAGTLTLNSNLAADSVSVVSKAGAGGVVINSGSNLYALQSLNWTGGNVSGSGNFEVGSSMGGTDTINGGDATNKPTLGCRMDIGTSYLGTNYSGGLTFATSSQPLVVNSNANIYINGGSSLTFMNGSGGNGSDMTAITNGDTNVHTIIVNGGTLNRTNYCQLFVCTGLDVESGTVAVGNPQGQNAGSPLHFTRPTSAGPGLLVNGGNVNFGGDFTSDFPGHFHSGQVIVASGSTLTLGVNANSASSGEDGGTFYLEGTLVPHGGFVLLAGTFGTDGYDTALVSLDAGTVFDMEGGELDITKTGFLAAAIGKLEINGDFEANGGEILDSVDTSDLNNLENGVFQVDGNATLTTSTTFASLDLNQNPPANYTHN